MTTVRVTTTPQYIVQSAVDDAARAGVANADKGSFVVANLIANGYAIREAAAPLMIEWDELLAALAERDLHWVNADEDEKGYLREGPEEPPVGAVVLDLDGDAWQNRKAGAWRAIGYAASCSWADLCRVYGPVVLLTADSAAAADDQQDRS